MVTAEAFEEADEDPAPEAFGDALVRAFGAKKS
jgi:hypothetical protein